VEADLLADQIREEARGVYGARQNYPHWPTEKATLFIRRTKITSNMKYHLTSQLTDPKMRAHIMAKQEWRDLMFNEVDWSVLECFRDSIQMTIKEQTNSGEQKLPQFVANGETKRAYISRKENMLYEGSRHRFRDAAQIVARGCTTLVHPSISYRHDHWGQKNTAVQHSSEIRHDEC
jgi:hypothetical protein